MRFPTWANLLLITTPLGQQLYPYFAGKDKKHEMWSDLPGWHSWEGDSNPSAPDPMVWVQEGGLGKVSSFWAPPSGSFPVHLQRKHRAKIKQQILFWKIFHLLSRRDSPNKKRISLPPSIPLQVLHSVYWACSHRIIYRFEGQTFCILSGFAFWCSRLFWPFLVLHEVARSGKDAPLERIMPPLRPNACSHQTFPLGFWSQTHWVWHTYDFCRHKKKPPCVHTCFRIM